MAILVDYMHPYTSSSNYFCDKCLGFLEYSKKNFLETLRVFSRPKETQV